MRFSTIATAAFAAGAVAGPVHMKRALVTEITYTTVTLYVTPGQEATPTPTPSKAPQDAVEKPKFTPPVEVVAPAPSSEVPVVPVPVETQAPAAPVETQAPAAPVEEKPAAPVETQTPAAPAAPTNADPTIQMYLDHHNVHRANHSADALTWDDALAGYAHTLAASCEWKHNVEIGGGGYGQNMAASGPDPNTASLISDGWYNGEERYFAPYYDIASPQVSEETFKKYGHFTQMVWKSSQKVGCATVDCTGSSLGMHFTVCNYSPPGNYANEYAKNVGRPLGQKTYTGAD